MIETRCNYRELFKELKCELCKTEDDTTEHLLECQELTGLGIKVKKEELHDPNYKIIEYVNKIMEKKRKIRGQNKGWRS